MIDTSQQQAPEPVSRWREIVLVLAVAVALSLIFWLPLWQGAGLVGGDIYTYFFPQKAYFAEHLQKGHFPLWNNRVGHGYPLVGESQTGAFYPFHLLYALLDVNTAYNAVQLSHYLLAFLLTWLYARRIGLTTIGALLAATVYVYGWFPPRICLEWAIIGGTWFPLALWAVEGYLSDQRRGYLALLTVALGLQLLAGHFHLAFITQLVVVLYVSGRLWLASRGLPVGTMARRTGVALKLASAVGLAFGLSAVQLLPTWELKQSSQRESVVGRKYEPGYGHMPVVYWSQLVAPRWWYSRELVQDNTGRIDNLGDYRLKQSIPEGAALTNQVEAHLYFGLASIVLILLGGVGVAWRVIGRRRNPDRTRPLLDSRLVLWVTLSLLALCYTPGWWLPLTRHLPGFGFFTGPGRYGIVTCLGAALLAGAVFSWVLEKLSMLHPLERFVATLGLAAAVVGTFWCLGPAEAWPQEWGLVGGLFAAVTLGWFLASLAAAGWKRGRTGLVLARTTLTVVLLGTLVLDLWIVSRLQTYSVPRQVPLVSGVESSPVRALLRQYESGSRVDSVSGPRSPVRLFCGYQNLPTLLGVASTPVYLGIGPVEYFQEHLRWLESGPGSQISAENVDWLQKAGVTHVLSLEPLDTSTWPVRLVERVTDQEFLQVAFAGHTFFYLYELIGSRGRLSWLEATGAERAEIVVYEPNRVEARVSSEGGGRVVLTDLAYPGWIVRLDGKPAETVVVEGLYRGVDVPAGDHRLEWVYRPGPLWWGSCLSLCSLLLGIGLLLAPRSRLGRLWGHE